MKKYELINVIDNYQKHWTYWVDMISILVKALKK